MDGGGDSFESQTEEIEEKRYIRAYWRAEEGHGNQIADVSDRGLHLTVKEGDLVWHPQVNPDRDPIDYEDKWGKANQANYSFYAPFSGLNITKKENQAIQQKSRT